MKILCVIDSLGSGGAQRQLVNLAVAFKEKGHDVDFLVYHNDNFYLNFLEKNGIKVIFSIEKSYIKRVFKIRKIIRNGKYNTVLSFLEAPNFICELAVLPFKSWRLIVGERSANPDILKSFKLILFRFLHIFSDYVVANSYENINIVKKVNPILRNSKCHVIYNLIDFDKWSPKLDEYIFKNNGKLKISIAARHHYLKNLNCLVEAVNLLSDSEKSQLLIEWYGREEDHSLSEALIKIHKYKLHDVFNFYPATIDIHKKVNASDVVGLFSFYEGLPNAVCEGMVNGKLVISSNISDVPMLIEPQFIFDPNIPSELTSVLKRVLSLSENEFKNIGQSNRNKALKLFSEDVVVTSYLNLFD